MLNINDVKELQVSSRGISRKRTRAELKELGINKNGRMPFKFKHLFASGPGDDAFLAGMMGFLGGLAFDLLVAGALAAAGAPATVAWLLVPGPVVGVVVGMYLNFKKNHSIPWWGRGKEDAYVRLPGTPEVQRALVSAREAILKMDHSIKLSTRSDTDTNAPLEAALVSFTAMMELAASNVSHEDETVSLIKSSAREIETLSDIVNKLTNNGGSIAAAEMAREVVKSQIATLGKDAQRAEALAKFTTEAYSELHK